MNIHLAKCLDVQINHTYFSKGICDVLTLVPTAATQLLMKNYSLELRKFSNQFSLYCAMNKDMKSTLQQELVGLDTLSFQIYSSDTYFINYTDLPYPNPEGTIYYFSNQVNVSDKSALQKEQYASALDQLVYKSFVFSVSLPSEKNVILTVKNSEGKNVIQQEFDGTQIKSYTINLKPYGEGSYTLWINGKQQASYFVSGESLSENCLGILQLKVPELLAVISGHQNQILHLSFNARSTYWKYSIVLGTDRQITIKDMSIEASGAASYDGPKAATIVGGIAASIFTSSKPVPLNQDAAFKQLLKVRYYNKFSDRLNEIDITIPSPDISKLVTKENDANILSFYSSKIIHI